MLSLKHLLILGFLLLLPCIGRAQYPVHFNFNADNGIPCNEVYSLLQDKKGFVWLGCDAGLYRFDGIHHQSVSCYGQRSKSITGLCQTADGTIYCYNFTGQIFTIRNGKLSVVPGWNGSIVNISVTQQGELYVTGEKGLSIYNPNKKQWKVLSTVASVKNGFQKQTYACRVLDDQTLWFTYLNGVGSVKNKVLKTYSLQTEHISSEYILIEKGKNPWLFGVLNGGVYRLKGGVFEAYNSPKLTAVLKGRKLTNAVTMPNGDIWITSYSGIIVFNPSNGNCHVLYPSVAFSDIEIDREGSCWISSLHEGVFRIPTVKCKVWNSSTNALLTDNVTAMTSDESAWYFASPDGKITRLNRSDNALSFFEIDTKSDITCLYHDAIDRCIYIASNNFLYKQQNGKLTKINNRFFPVKSMMHTPDGYYIGTSRGTFFLTDLTEELTGKEIIPDWSRNFEQFNQHVCVATNNGLFVVNGSKKKFFLKGKQILALAKDEKNKLLYCVRFDGAVFSLDRKWQLKKVVQLPAEYQVHAMHLANNQLVFATNQGLQLVNLSTKQWRVLDRYSGLVTANVADFAFAGEAIWCATDKGFQLIPLKMYSHNAFTKIYLKRLYSTDQRKLSGNTVELDYSEGICFELEGIAYRSMTDFQLAYRLNGASGKWVYFPAGTKVITIPRLPIGMNKIEWRLVDYRGKFSDSFIQLRAYVAPPLWQRWWFLLLLGAAGILIGIALFRKRIRLLEQKQQKELARLKLENELRLTQQNALKAQMNPHFLFNVLNSIKGYIYENDKINASKYLSDFSNLVRKILEMSSMTTTPLYKEIEALTLYIELEAMLLQNNFSYTIEVDEQIDVSYTHIPALLIQPYIENAFKHGLRHKREAKTLTLHFAYSDNKELLVVTIQDNGIGRKAAAQINLKTDADHTSFATQAMEKRLALLNHDKKDIGVEIIDNFDEEGKASGTTIIIRIHVS